MNVVMAKKTAEPEQPTVAEQRAASARSGWVDNTTVENAKAALQGHFVKVTSGEHAGRYGVFDAVASVTDRGLPETIIVITRDDRNERLVVGYDECERAEAGLR